MAKKPKAKNSESLETKLWKSSDALRKNIDAAEYKHVVLGLVFLKYISDVFDAIYEELKKDPYADPDDKDEYLGRNGFYIPESARWNEIKKHAKSPEIGRILDEVMDEIERENPQLKGVLPKVYSKGNIDPLSLGGLIDLFDNIELEAAKEKSADILGYVFEYFLGQFALDEGKKGGQFYTPKSVVELLVEMIQPFKGRVFDPCCGSGGMFVQSENFVTAHQGKVDDISIFGQESNQTTWKLCKMNLAIRGIDGSQIKWNNEGSLLNDAHKGLKADFILANPPFNQKEWGREHLENDPRWQHGIPPSGNANYAWIQHFIYHLNDKGKAGFVLAKGSLTSKQKEEYEIRKNLIDADLIECIVNLPPKLFLNTGIPACLWFINKNKKRKGEILFIDARDMGELINRRLRVLKSEDIKKIADTYHEWQKGSDGNYQDIAGFCKSASLEDVRNLDYILTSGRYVGLPDEDDDFDFMERFNKLKAEFEMQIKEEEGLNKLILENLARLDLGGQRYE